MDFIAIDFETANQDRNSACEIAVCVVKDDEIVEHKSWLIRPPELWFDPWNSSIHGLSEQDVVDKPKFNKLWEEVKPYFEGNVLVAHFASFDLSVLRHTLDTYHIKYPQLSYLCTYTLSKRIWNGFPSYDLFSLCQHHQIEFEHHRALPDSIACAKLCLKVFQEAEIKSLQDIEEKLNVTIGQLFLGRYRSCGFKHEPKDYKNIIGDPSKHKPDHFLYGKKIVFTGTLTSMVRSKAQQIVTDIGGINADSISKETDFLIVGQQDFRRVGEDGMSSKQEKALKLLQKGYQIEVLPEEAFLNLIDE